MKELTSRQWTLYNYLKEHYDPKRYISKNEIVSALPQYYEIKEGETRTCRDIEFDVRDINSSEIIQKIIVSNSKGYKIGTKEQVANYIVSRIEEAKRSLVLSYKLAHKAELNNQARITFGKDERNVIEAYIKEEKEQEVNNEN